MIDLPRQSALFKWTFLKIGAKIIKIGGLVGVPLGSPWVFQGGPPRAPGIPRGPPGVPWEPGDWKNKRMPFS